MLFSVRPLCAEELLTEFILLDLPFADHASRIEAEIEAADAGKQRAVGDCGMVHARCSARLRLLHIHAKPMLGFDLLQQAVLLGLLHHVEE